LTCKELKAHLDRNQVHAAITAALSAKKCFTLSQFANLVDERKDWNKFVTGITDIKDVDKEIEASNVKTAWREADSNFSGSLKRKSEGLYVPDVGIDDPLEESVMVSVKSDFQTNYDWKDFDSARIGSDSMHGRFKREFDKKLPTMYCVLRAKSLAAAAKAPTMKKSKLDNDITITSRAEPEEAAKSLSSWFSCLDIIVNTWAVTGCFNVTHGGKEVKYCHWQDADSYKHEFHAMALELLGSHTEWSTFSYLYSMEEKFRAKAIEMARSKEEVPWGTALLRSQQTRKC